MKVLVADKFPEGRLKEMAGFGVEVVYQPTIGAKGLVGGIRDGGKIVVGPEEPEKAPIMPMLFQLRGTHEILGVGTLFPDESHKPRLHMHAALGRGGETRAGCIRPGIEVWKVGEVILLEIAGSPAFRKKDPATGFELLEP